MFIAQFISLFSLSVTDLFNKYYGCMQILWVRAPVAAQTRRAPSVGPVRGNSTQAHRFHRWPAAEGRGVALLRTSWVSDFSSNTTSSFSRQVLVLQVSLLGSSPYNFVTTLISHTFSVILYPLVSFSFRALTPLPLFAASLLHWRAYCVRTGILFVMSLPYSGGTLLT